MILIDTSIWIDHLRAKDERLVGLLDREEVLMHPGVIGELALGTLRDRIAVLANLSQLKEAAIASDGEVLGMIEHWQLAGSGIGWVDAHLLASARLTPSSCLWTRDKRLRAVAERLEIAA